MPLSTSTHKHLHILTILLLLLTLTPLSLSRPQIRPPPPPDACFRRNDTLPACPYGGECNPAAGYLCQRSCVDYQALDNRFWCTLPCGYAATTLAGVVAPNPLLCTQPSLRNGLACTSGWACYRRFSAKGPMFRTPVPVCSPDYRACDVNAQAAGSGNATGNATATATTTTIETLGVCSTGQVCVEDPRWSLAKAGVEDEKSAICADTSKPCSGLRWDECGHTSHCVKDPRCTGTLGKECKGICINLLGPTWGSWNKTQARFVSEVMC